MNYFISIFLFFILSFVPSHPLVAQDAIHCEQFKTGEFITRFGVNIQRKKHIQKESWIDENGKKHKIWYRIKWVDNCSYTLKFLYANRKAIRKEHRENGKRLIVQILESDAEGYSYRAKWANSDEWKFYNQLYEIEDQVSDIAKNK